MCLRLSSREKKKNRNSPSWKTVGDKQAPPLASHHSLASPSEKGKSSCSSSDMFRPRAMRIRLSASFQRLPSPARKAAKLRPDHHGGGSGVWHCSGDSQLSPLKGSTELSSRIRIIRRASGSLTSRCLGTGCETPVAGLRYQSCLPPCRTKTHPPCSINLIRSARFMA